MGVLKSKTSSYEASKKSRRAIVPKTKKNGLQNVDTSLIEFAREIAKRDKNNFEPKISPKEKSILLES